MDDESCGGVSLVIALRRHHRQWPGTGANTAPNKQMQNIGGGVPGLKTRKMDLMENCIRKVYRTSETWTFVFEMCRENRGA